MTALVLLLLLLGVVASALILLASAGLRRGGQPSSPQLGDGPPDNSERLWWPGVEPPIPRDAVTALHVPSEHLT